MRFLLLFTPLLFSINMMAQETVKLIYFADPMCSWCYGFSPELTKVVNEMDDSIAFEMVMGGLRPYNQETMTDLSDFLKEHWHQVSERSGQPFTYDILQDGSIVYDTEPACRAVAIMRDLKPEKAYPFFKAVQTAFYKKNKNPIGAATYLELAEEFGVDKAVFKQAFESAEWKAKIKEDFQYSADIGVRSFPTLVLQNGKDVYLLSSGYAKADEVLKKISKIIMTPSEK